MKKINIKGVNEVIYYEKLDNGMEVYLYNNNRYHNNIVTFTTKFGSIYNEFIPNGEKDFIKVPNGIAHFLEHKLFAQEQDPQPMEFYAKTGTMCNAYTTFKNTTYLFYGTNNLIENINFLLDYVQSPYFTEENVESEKGIINEEINMCDDRPTDILYDEIRKCIFKKNNFKESIIGTHDEVNSITKDLLYTCYNTFYHPSNMFLVITGSFDPEEVLSSIKENQNKKEFAKTFKTSIKEIKEPDEVVKEKSIININTDIPKYSYNVKIPYLKDIDKRKLSLYLYIMLSSLFDDTSDFDYTLKEAGIITNSVYFNVLNCDTHILLSLINETPKYKELDKKITEIFADLNVLEKDFERKKRVLVSNEIYLYDNIELVNDMIVDNILFDNTLKDDVIPMIKELNYEEFVGVISKLNTKNISRVIVEKQKNEKTNNKPSEKK